MYRFSFAGEIGQRINPAWCRRVILARGGDSRSRLRAALFDLAQFCLCVLALGDVFQHGADAVRRTVFVPDERHNPC